MNLHRWGERVYTEGNIIFVWGRAMVPWIFSILSVGLAQESNPVRINLNVGGMAIQGNLTQYQMRGGGLISYSKERYGNDTVLNGYRMWTKLPGNDELTKIGDDLHISDIAYLYVKPKLYVQGFGHYSTSQLHQIDHRMMGGVSLGMTPVREKQKLFRASLGGFWENTVYPSDVFNIDVSHNGTVRSVPRIGMISNGWYRVPNNQQFSFRYLAWFHVNPLDVQDYRFRVHGEGNIHLTPVLSMQLSTTYEYSSVVMEGVSVYDMRSNVGLGISIPPKKR